MRSLYLCVCVKRGKESNYSVVNSFFFWQTDNIVFDVPSLNDESPIAKLGLEETWIKKGKRKWTPGLENKSLIHSLALTSVSSLSGQIWTSPFIQTRDSTVVMTTMSPTNSSYQVHHYINSYLEEHSFLFFFKRCREILIGYLQFPLDSFVCVTTFNENKKIIIKQIAINF